eukprot:10836975-Ditylum_brightwellii.AAC.1
MAHSAPQVSHGTVALAFDVWNSFKSNVVLGDVFPFFIKCKKMIAIIRIAHRKNQPTNDFTPYVYSIYLNIGYMYLSANSRAQFTAILSTQSQLKCKVCDTAV